MRQVLGFAVRLWRNAKFLIVAGLAGGAIFVAYLSIQLFRDVGWCISSPIQCVLGKPGPRLPPKLALEKSNRWCLETLAADDGVTRIQHMFWAHAALNQSDKTGLTICEIHKTKRTLKAPSQYGTAWPRYPAAAKRLDDNSLVGDKGNVAQATLEVERVLAHRTEDYERYPCLQFVMGGIRPWKWGTYQDERKFQSEMDLLFVEGDARFYGPKGSPKCR